MPMIKIDGEDLAVATYIFTDCFDTLDDEENPIFLEAPNICEKQLCISQMKQNMSEEGQEVLNLLLNCPSEILEEITNDTGIFIKGKIRTYLKECSWKQSTINKVFKELRKFNQELGEI